MSDTDEAARVLQDMEGHTVTEQTVVSWKDCWRPMVKHSPATQPSYVGKRLIHSQEPITAFTAGRPDTGPIGYFRNLWLSLIGHSQPINHTSTREDHNVPHDTSIFLQEHQALDVVAAYPPILGPIGHTRSESSRQSIAESTSGRIGILETPSSRRRKPAIQQYGESRSGDDGSDVEKPPPAKRKSGSRRAHITRRPFACHFFQRSPEAWSHNASCARSYSDLNKLK
jgi:hypothetical protein